MADIIWTDVTDLVASLATGVAVPIQAMILGLVNGRVAPSNFGGVDSPTFRLARISLAAHLGQLNKTNAGFIGTKTSQSEGGVSVSFSVPTITDPLLGTTYGGRLFLWLIRTSPAVVGFLT